MKKHFLFGIAAAIAIIATSTSCSKNSSASTEKFGSSLTGADTTIVLDKANACMEALKEDHLAEAVDMLRVINSDGQVSKLTDEEKEELINRFRNFPVLNYRLESIKFDESDDNLLKYQTEFFLKKPGDNTPNTIAVVFNPVKVDGEWYLTFKTTKQR